ncbi:hypothetical protein KVG96_14400 [Pseudomonas sp. COR58]|uniref:Holin n=1 Tax=Pseudomonas ekonensis TaxID=2842353 RepID=A0ABS6PF94_9PSED|nr:hypothetical protein [Pseudomonas ekonensis]
MERDKTQLEREKAQEERYKRLELIAEQTLRAAEGAQEAARQVINFRTSYWAGVAVQFLAGVAILVGAIYTNQANVMVAIQTTLAAVQSVKEASARVPVATPVTLEQ